QGRLTAAELGLLINVADPYSVAVGEYYARRRDIPEANILRVSLPTRATLSVAEFDVLNEQVQAKLGPAVQALALAWSQPYAVECNSITAALAMGFQADICKQSCAASKLSPNSYLGRGATTWASGRPCCWRPAVSKVVRP
ncbi:TIGR03790 family protein, partial [Roseateles sp. GG27B]